ncbi:ribonuclease H-like domain-containing protein [Tanacetum coccineum]
MRNKPGMDSLSFDDLYNNLRVFENDVKGSTASSSNLQNVAFVSENTSSTNDVSTAYGVSNASGHNSKHEQTSSYSLLASQSSCPQLDHEDLDQVDEYDLEEMDLKWQVAMISMRIKKFYKKTGRKLQFDAKEPVGFDKTKVECYNCHKTGHFARECRTKEDNKRRDGWNTRNKDGSRTGKKEESKALVTVDGESVDWTTHSEDDENYAFMASNSSGSDTQVPSCSNECKESYANLKRLYDAQREQLSDASVEIKAYTQGLKKVEAQLVAHQQGQLWYEQKIKFMKIDLDDKTDVLTYHKKLLAKAQKEKDDLEVIVDKWNHSSKNLGKIVNHHMSARDKFRLGYGDYRYSGNLSYENEVFQSVFKSNKGDFENPPFQIVFKSNKEFKNRDIIEFCGLKGIKREYSNARTPQQNGVAERKNRTLIEAARTMLADSFLPNTFGLKQLVLLAIYIRPFGCHVTILNTIDHLGKFAGKSDEGFLVGYSLQSKAFRVYNLVTKRVEENLHIKFLENKPNVAGKGPNWLFDLDYLTDSMNYLSVSSENQANIHAGQQESNQNAGTKDKIVAGDSEKEDESAQDCFEHLLLHHLHH